MTTMKNWFDQFTADTGEKVEFICLGEVPTWWGKRAARWDTYQPNVVLPFGGGEPWLDVDFDEGFGGNETPNCSARVSTDKLALPGVKGDLPLIAVMGPDEGFT